MKPYIKDLLIILLILLCFYVGCNWSKQDVRNFRTTDTVYVKGETIIKVDTFYREKTIYKPVATLVYVGDSSRYVDCDSIREYTESLEDSSGLVVVESTVQGELIDQKITLQSYVTSTFRVDTLKTTTFRPTYAAFVTMQFDSLGYVKPAIGFQYGRKRVSYSGSINTNKEVTLGIYYNFAR